MVGGNTPSNPTDNFFCPFGIGDLSGETPVNFSEFREGKNLDFSVISGSWEFDLPRIDCDGSWGRSMLESPKGESF